MIEMVLEVQGQFGKQSLRDWSDTDVKGVGMVLVILKNQKLPVGGKGRVFTQGKRRYCFHGVWNRPWDDRT